MEHSHIRYIAFFDILGFKDIVYNNSHETLDTIYESLFESSFVDITSRWKKVQEKFTIAEDLIEFAIISDSIVLWTKDLSQKSFIQLFFFARKLLQNGFYSGIPLRGALSAGPITAKNTNVGNLTIYGKGFTDAYVLEESQSWSGCIIDEKAINYLIDATKMSEGANLTDLERLKYLTKYTLKLKDNIEKEFYVINWNIYFDSNFTEADIENSFSLFNKKISDRTQIIIKNTIEFYRKLLLCT